MRALGCAFIFCLFAQLPAVAQTLSLADSIYSELANSPWLYPTFIQGKIVFRDGTSAKAALNYNMELGYVEFINNGKDTMAIADEGDLRFIAVDADTFYYDKQYLQALGGNADVKLAKHTSAKLTNTKRTGAFGTTTESPGVTYYSTIGRDEGVIHLKDPQGQVFKKVTTYYMGDKYNHFVPLTRKNLMKRYDSDKETLSTYLDLSHINLTSEEDVKRLGAYLAAMNK